MSWPWAHFSWELRACGWRGHETYRPDERDLAERLVVPTPHGEAWRCLRCGTYVIGEPRGGGPADEAPIVLRGRALRDAFVLRLLALDKTLRGIFLCVVGLGIWRFGGSRAALRQTLDAYLPLLQPLLDRLGLVATDIAAVHLIERAFELQPVTISLIAAGIGAYGLLNLLEATGLWLMKRWGEYVAAVSTSVFLPLEIYEVVEKVTLLRVGALVVNVFLVIYLVVTKRLFGVRGGHAAVERERHHTSLLEVERSATLRSGAGRGQHVPAHVVEEDAAP